MIKIALDSCSNITIKEAEAMGVTLIPLNITFGTETYLDEIEIGKKEFYERLVKTKELPKTSQPSPEYFIDLFQSAKESGDEVLYISLSAKLSGTYAAAEQAKKHVGYDKICLYDSETVGECILFLANEALKYRADESMEKIVARLDALKKKIDVYAVIDTLEYLHRGGRLSRSVALIGALLNIKPIGTMRNGVVTIVGRQRGAHRACNFIKETVEKEGIDRNYPVYYGYSLSDENCRLLISKLSETPEEDAARAKNLSPVIGAHIGPNCAYVMFVRK